MLSFDVGVVLGRLARAGRSLASSINCRLGNELRRTGALAQGESRFAEFQADA
jgi:hypothetical protein